MDHADLQKTQLNSPRVAHLLLISLVGLAFFLPSLWAGFVGDNLDQIINPDILHLQHGYLRPLFVLSIKLDALVWGTNPVGFHLTNLVVHIATTLMVYLLALQLAMPRNASLAASLFFLLHPIHALAIFWISGRCDMISALFYTAGLVAFFKVGTTPRKTLFLVVSILFYVAALLSKEMALSFIPVAMILLGILTTDRKQYLGGLPILVPHGIATLAYFAARIMLLGDRWLVNEAHQQIHITVLLKNFMTYLGLLVVPAGHIAIGDFLRSYPWAFVAAGFLLSGTLLVFFGKFKSRHMLLLTTACVVTLLPVLRLAMRWYLYIPSIPFCLALSHIVASAKFPPKDKLKKAAVFLLILGVFAIPLWIHQTQWVTAGKLASELSHAIAGKMDKLGTREAVVLNTVAEVNEIPVLIFNTGLYVNFAHFGDYDSLLNWDVYVGANLSLRGPQSLDSVTVTPRGARTYDMTVSGDGSYFTFVDHQELAFGRAEPYVGMVIEHPAVRLRCTKLDHRNRVIQMNAEVTRPDLPVCFFSHDTLHTDLPDSTK